MLKRIGLFSLLLFAASATVLPQTAHAQEGYYGQRNNYYDGDGYGYRHDDRRWKDGDDRRYAREDREWRKHERREREYREHEWREHRRWDRDYRQGYYPDSYFYFQYGR